MTDPSGARRTDPAMAPGAVDVTRRHVLATGSVLVAAVAVTAACGSSPDSTGDSGPAGAGDGGGARTIPTSDVPVGGGEILAEQQVVITQPAAGTFRAFTAVCTHQRCLVGRVADGEIVCPCHGSTFSIADGSVTGGPATAPLKEVPFTVSGDTITLT